jgi:hypothetical protein
MTDSDFPVESRGPLSEDPHWKLVGPRFTYVGKPVNEVTYGRVERDGQTIGFIYFSDAEDAVGYVSLRSAGDKAANAGQLWAELMKFQWERHLTPSEAVAEIEAGEGIGDGLGHLVSGSLTETASSYRALKELAKKS